MTNSAELVAAAIRRDSEAVAEIYDRYAPGVYGYCFTRLGNVDDAADATQSTFLKAIERLDQVRDPDRLRAWIFATARNEVADEGRRRSRSTPVANAGDDKVDETGPGHGRRCSQGETAELIAAASLALVERDREVLALHLAAGLAPSEIADELGVEPEHARVLLNRMRSRLKSSISLLLVTRWGRAHCSGLDLLLVEWDGVFTREVRARVQGHVGGCATCKEAKSSLTRPETLLPQVLPIALPAFVRSQVLGGLGLGASGVGVGAGGGVFAAAAASVGKLAASAALVISMAAVTLAPVDGEPDRIALSASDGAAVELATGSAASGHAAASHAVAAPGHAPQREADSTEEAGSIGAERSEPVPTATAPAIDETASADGPVGEGTSEDSDPVDAAPGPQETPPPAGEPKPSDEGPHGGQTGGSGGAGAVLDETLDRVGQMTEDVTDGLGDLVESTTDGLGETVDGLTDDVGELLGGPFAEPLDGLGDDVDETLDELGDTVDEVLDGTGESIDDVTGGFGDLLGGLIDPTGPEEEGDADDGGPLGGLLF